MNFNENNSTVSIFFLLELYFGAAETITTVFSHVWCCNGRRRSDIHILNLYFTKQF